MKWEQYRHVMEKNAIKTDDMATEDAYFLATHMPFSHLEVYTGGRTSDKPKLMNEQEVFDRLVCNPDNEHRMIIVRGDNGTGKSHLIRYLKAKLENSLSPIYDPETEQLVFLRRLNNSVRGAFNQLIEQRVVKDPAVKEKLQKFVASSDAKDEAAFKNDILFAYIAAVSNDQTGQVYKPVICRDIVSYLSDYRVRGHLLREGGAISRCYNVITAPSNQVLKETSIFMEDDFNVSKIIREVYKQGEPQAQDYASTLKGDEEEIKKLVGYLNRLARTVVQRCADISSESTKSVFEQLRKDLKGQGKNLTLFIEDFTGFTGIDSELITVLSTEHGGDYADLCRVTAVIGITNFYYDQFKDNFTDRVTHQISVTEQAYGTDDFLVQITARYLNAIYLNPEDLHAWYKDGASPESLPVSDFSPPCPWASIVLHGKTVTLYPFNKRSLPAMYEHLSVKSPRMFLKEVLRQRMKEYLDGKQYGDEWAFPGNPANVQMRREQHSSSIDRLESFTLEDKNRLKALFALWGDNTAAVARQPDGTVIVGGLDHRFLCDLGLGAFMGIGEILDSITGQGVESPPIRDAAISIGAKASRVAAKPPVVNPREKRYREYKEDINNWYAQGETLRYHPDYRKWLQEMISGDARSCGMINWQDMGVPAYVAKEQLSHMERYYIEGQGEPSRPNRLMVYMERSSESRDALLALIEHWYAGGWAFEGSVYYQQRLITWLERRKTGIITAVRTVAEGEPPLPIAQWCLALQYIRGRIIGAELDLSSPNHSLSTLLEESKPDTGVTRETDEWRDLLQFMKQRSNELDQALALLQKSSVTVMGSIYTSEENAQSNCYRAGELLEALEQLNAADWDIRGTLPLEMPEKHLLYNPARLLKTIYTKVDKVAEAEKKQAETVLASLEDYIGPLNHDKLVEALSAVQELFAAFQVHGILGGTELRARYEKSPSGAAKRILTHIAMFKASASDRVMVRFAKYSGGSLSFLSNFLRDLQNISSMAEDEEARAKRDMLSIAGHERINDKEEAARATLERLCEQLETMEVHYAADTNN